MKTIKEINEKIKNGSVVVLTAEEVIALKKRSLKDLAEEIDVVTTSTFGPMCSSGIYFNIGHSKPRIKLGGGRVTLNSVPCYPAFAAVDLFLGATSLPENDPRNVIYPGEFRYGGGHVIEDLVSKKDLLLDAVAYGTDCYPRKNLKVYINIDDLNEAVLFNIRNCYQNYNVAVNLSNRILYTYMGVLGPNLANANYCSSGALSPLLKDPFYKTIGIGTRIFLGGGIGYVAWWGTQHNPCVERTEKGIPKYPAGTLALIGDLKNMSPKYLVGTSILGYGATLSIGIGIPIPILNEEILSYVLIDNDEIFAPIVDYSSAYPNRQPDILGFTTYKELNSGVIKIGNKEVKTGSLSSIRKAREIANILKNWIKEAKFFLTEPQEKIPSVDSNYRFRPLKDKTI